VPIEPSAKLDYLNRIHLFHELKEEELSAIADKLEEVSYPAGSVIFEQGKKPESFSLIYEGTVRITRKQERREIQLALLVKDDYFGEMGLISKRTRSGTATALTDISLFVMSREDFEKFYKSIPQLRLNFDLAIRSRQLARKLQFSWLRPDEVSYFLARKDPIVLCR
jgi:CRP-like cAMP-binding protein